LKELREKKTRAAFSRRNRERWKGKEGEKPMGPGTRKIFRNLPPKTATGLTETIAYKQNRATPGLQSGRK